MNELEFMEFDRIQKIQSVIEKYGEENFYLSFSGGRDSTVLSKLIDVALPENKIPRVFVNTGIEYRKIVDFVAKKKAEDDRIVIVNAGINLKEMLEQDGYPFQSKLTSLRYSKWKIKHDRGIKDEDMPPYIRKWLRIEDVYDRNGNPYPQDREGTYKLSPKLMKVVQNDWNDFKISDRCCHRLKMEPLESHVKQSGKTISITGMSRFEGGRRSKIQCLAFTGKTKDEPSQFHPFAPVTNAFIDYLIEKYDIRLCDLYYEPYRFKRTGCKGCPFAPRIKEQLDILEQYFPSERKQCEMLFGKVYDIYRECGFRHMNEPTQLGFNLYE